MTTICCRLRLFLVLAAAVLGQVSLITWAQPDETRSESSPERAARTNSGTDTVNSTAENSAGRVYLATLSEDQDQADSAADNEPLPPLQEELERHGGSYLYEPLDEKWPSPEQSHPLTTQRLRLPDDWQAPQPLTAFQEFLGEDPVRAWPGYHWFGEEGFQWEPRFVAYGSYELFGIVLEENRRRLDALGHQLLLDLDLQLTGTERFHLQFRPLGEKNTGGSFLRLNDPVDYIDNSTAIPDRYWFEGEFFSLFGGMMEDASFPRDYHFAIGKFPLALHNGLLINDDILGATVNKNTILAGPLSNLNVMGFVGLDDVDAFADSSSDVLGLHAAADFHHALLETTYAFSQYNRASGRDAHFAAVSLTRFVGPFSMAGRALLRAEDRGEHDLGQLYTVESNWTRRFPHHFYDTTGIKSGVFYLNVFGATRGWSPISGGNVDRLRSAFAADPLVRIVRGRRPDRTAGAALGVQLFRRHQDESFVPEISFESPGGVSVWGTGLQYLRKLGARTYLQALGVRTWSDQPEWEREGVFISTFWVF